MEMKCVIVLDENLPTGQLANAAAALTMTLGKKHPDLVGRDLVDNDGNTHLGITTIGLPILKGGNKIPAIRDGAKDSDEMTVVDLVSATSSTRSYDEYAQELEETPTSKLQYYGIALYGPKKVVNKYAGSLGLLR